MYTLDEIQEYHKKLPSVLFEQGYNKQFPFVFLDFEVFKYDWMLCFSIDGIHIKHIVNDNDKLRTLFLDKFKDKICIAYNGNGYDKFIMSGILNDINPKEVNDKLINSFNFNYNKEYGDRSLLGKLMTWYDPSTRLTGSLKTYEACQGENIYESNVPFDIDRKLNPDEIEETIHYCSFDVEMLIKYFYNENFDTFLGHLGLCNSLMEKRYGKKLYQILSRTDAGLVGEYLCSKQAEDPTKDDDIIILPDNIILGKYKDRIEKFLQVPIKTLKNGSYNGLNAWSINTINKSLAACDTNDNIEKLKKNETKTIEKIKKKKIKLQELNSKSKLTAKQLKDKTEIPNEINEFLTELKLIRNNIQLEENGLKELKDLKQQLSKFENDDYMNPNYNYILSKILDMTRVTDNIKLQLLISYLTLSQEELFSKRYKEDKKNTPFDTIMIIKPFELMLDIKGIPHAFKTGGIHSIATKPLFFDKNTEHDKNRRLLIADVGSLYPNIMRVFGLCSIGMDDPEEYTKMIKDRIVLKKQGDPFAQVLKLILNTTYGCMGSNFNFLYDPTNRLKVCIYGEACIVDLLDKLEDQIKGLEIFQSNTDGILISCEDYEYDKVEEIIHEWERRTGLEMEIDESLALYQRDVSNYILIEK
nr:MAG TPA: DNA polymerase [Caudoviricetes sp.]